VQKTKGGKVHFIKQERGLLGRVRNAPVEVIKGSEKLRGADTFLGEKEGQTGLQGKREREIQKKRTKEEKVHNV